MDAQLAPSLVRDARRRAGLTQRELARRSGVEQPVISAYERGRRQPTLPTLLRLLRAAGFELDAELRPARRLPDPERAGRILLQALDLADHFPRRRRPDRLGFPRLP